MIERRVENLEALLPPGFKNSKQYSDSFENFARFGVYLNNGIYGWRGNYSVNTRELFVMGLLDELGINYNKF